MRSYHQQQREQKWILKWIRKYDKRRGGGLGLLAVGGVYFCMQPAAEDGTREVSDTSGVNKTVRYKHYSFAEAKYNGEHQSYVQNAQNFQR